jgi:hypothetical protein
MGYIVYRPSCAARSSWMGGQGTSPYEQNTQQSPGSGRIVAPQASQCATTTQASSGIVRADAAPQLGQVSVDRSRIVINRSFLLSAD